MKQGFIILGACVSATLLAACGSGASISPATTIPQLARSVVRDASPTTGCATNSCVKGVSAYRVLHSFSGGDGAGPSATLLEVSGALYGTTEGGGSGSGGTVFSISTKGKEKTFYDFGPYGPGPSVPVGGLIDVNGVFYGTTYGGGTTGWGTIFSITTGGMVTVLHSFSGAYKDGGSPYASLLNVNGTLYGTTNLGGSDNAGTVFSISTTGAKYRVLHSFSGVPDGLEPYGPLIDVNGILYGTTWGGGAGTDPGGTVFSISTTGKERVLHTFTGYPDGSLPQAGLLNVNGTLYGTTECGGAYDISGGSHYCTNHSGPGGTVFSITTTGSEAIVHSFGATKNDGDYPYSPLIAGNGTLYGVTFGGGKYDTGGSRHEGGTVFSLSTSGNERVLHSFGNGSDGLEPEWAGLTELNGKLYGMTNSGGANGDGIVYTLKP